MKKLSAIICSLIMTCAVFTGCGKSDSSSSKTDTSSAETSSVAVTDTTDSSSADTSTASDSTASDGSETLAEKYTQSLASKVYTLDMTITSDYTGEMPMVLSCDGTNYYISMSVLGMDITMYLVDNQMYVFDESSKSYSVSDMDSSTFNFDEEGVSSFGLDDSYTYVSTETTDDGLICETYSIDEASIMGEYDLGSGVTLETESTDSNSSSESSSYIKYYFDSATEELKSIEAYTMGMSQTVTINSFSTDNVTIELPDLSAWTLTDLSAETSTIEDDLTTSTAQ